jgi:uncharacterized membrane protein
MMTVTAKERMKGMRKNYIDNMRSLFVLLLFVYHTFMIYNSFGGDVFDVLEEP